MYPIHVGTFKNTIIINLIIKVKSCLLWLLDIVRANHFQGLMVPAKKRCVIEFSFLV